MIKDKGFFGEFLPEQEWEGKYLNEKRKIGKIGNFVFFMTLIGFLMMATAAYVILFDHAEKVMQTIKEVRIEEQKAYSLAITASEKKIEEYSWQCEIEKE